MVTEILKLICRLDRSVSTHEKKTNQRLSKIMTGLKQSAAKLAISSKELNERRRFVQFRSTKAG